MTYSVHLHTKLKDDFASIPIPEQTALRAAIRSLADTPRPMGVRKLAGIKYRSQSVYRIRVGGYRICYSIVDLKLLVTVVAAAKRSNIYRILKRRLP